MADTDDARPEHGASCEYVLIVLGVPEGDQADEERVERGHMETGVKIETAEMKTEEEDQQRAPPANRTGGEEKRGDRRGGEYSNYAIILTTSFHYEIMHHIGDIATVKVLKQ